MQLHPSTFEYLMPTEAQKAQMQRCRNAFSMFVSLIDQELPNGPDKTFVLRQLRDTAMWCNVAITRHADGAPRGDDNAF
jgi:hypothetical protein